MQAGNVLTGTKKNVVYGTCFKASLFFSACMHVLFLQYY